MLKIKKTITFVLVVAAIVVGAYGIFLFERGPGSYYWEKTTCAGTPLPVSDYTGKDALHWEAICVETKQPHIDVLRIDEACLNANENPCTAMAVVIYVTGDSGVLALSSEEQVTSLADSLASAHAVGKATDMAIVFVEVHRSGEQFYVYGELGCPNDPVEKLQADKSCEFHVEPTLPLLKSDVLWIGRFK